MRHLTGALVVLLAGVVSACAGDGAAPPPAPSTAAASTSANALTEPPARYAGRLTEQTNAARTAEGLDALAPSRCLARAAAGRADEIAGGPLEHRPLPDVANRCTSTGTVAENLVRSTVGPPDVVAAWMDSAGHRNNIVDPTMREVGTACRPDGTELLCVQLYAQAR